MYPGRASMSPLLDLLITLLHWGLAGWRRELAAREAVFPLAQARLREAAAGWGERLLETPGNPISLAITLDSLPAAPAREGTGGAGPSGERAAEPAEGPGGGGGAAEGRGSSPSFLGSMLFSRCVSGTRVVVRGVRQTVAGHEFRGYGAHCDAYPSDYLTVAAALGTSEAEVEEFVRRMGKCLAEFRGGAQRHA